MFALQLSFVEANKQKSISNGLFSVFLNRNYEKSEIDERNHQSFIHLLPRFEVERTSMNASKSKLS